VDRPPRIDVAVGAHHLDRAARDVASAEPDHATDPSRHRGRVEPLAGRERVEVAGEEMKGEGVLLAHELILNAVEQSAQLTRAPLLAPLREPCAKVENEQPRQPVAE